MIPARLGASAVTARVALPVTVITEAGIAPAVEVPGDPLRNHVVSNAAATGVIVVARNADGSSAHVVSEHPLPVDGQAVAPKDIPVAAGATVRFKAGHPVIYGKRVRLDVDSSQVKLTAYTVEADR